MPLKLPLEKSISSSLIIFVWWMSLYPKVSRRKKGWREFCQVHSLRMPVTGGTYDGDVG